MWVDKYGHVLLIWDEVSESFSAFFYQEQLQKRLENRVWQEMLPKLDYWKEYDELSDNGQFE